MNVSLHLCKTTIGIHSYMHTGVPKLAYMQICNCYFHEAMVAFHCVMHKEINIFLFTARGNDLCLDTHLQEHNSVYVSLAF